MANSPGAYEIVFTAETPHQPSIEQNGQPLLDRQFDATIGDHSTFTFTIQDPELQFTSPAIQWSEGDQEISQPSHISHQLDGNRQALTIDIDPPSQTGEQTFGFSLFFSNDTFIGDPTVVEKPPDGGPSIVG